jgi:hypothetical protein
MTGLVDERLSNAHAAACLGKLAQRFAAFLADAHLVEQRVHATSALGGRDAEQPAVVGEQFLGCQMIVKIGLFRQIAESALGREVASRASENARFAGRWKDELQ